MPADRTPAPIPQGFLAYLRAAGPGLVVALTWLGAGDLVDSAVAGGEYGYTLMWALALALIVRWLFVSMIAKYQLCNQHGESVLEGLCRLHRWFAPFVFLCTVLLVHAIQVYMFQGLGESLVGLTGVGEPWMWAVGWALIALALVFRPSFRRLEWIFLIFLGLLSVSLIGAALQSGPDPREMLAGTLGFRIPEKQGTFGSLLIVTSLIGAVGGSLANLMYPYFIRDKGWTTPAHRRVQRYDLAFGVLVIIVLDLAVWTVGAEVLYPDQKVTSTADLALMLEGALGHMGGVLIYLGIFGAVASSIIGNALGFSYLAADAYLLWQRPEEGREPHTLRTHRAYIWMALWLLFSPLVWIVAGKVDFVQLTVAVNALQVLVLPVLAGGLWAITAGRTYIGEQYRNRLWENALMAFLCALAVWAAWNAAVSVWEKFVATA